MADIRKSKSLMKIALQWMTLRRISNPNALSLTAFIA